MKRLLALVAGGLGLRALWRRRARSAPSPSAAELRAKLDQHRAREATAASSEEVPPEGVDERRADVHERARRAIDELS